nr:MAG: hypothetical protein [Microviridae sp.]
MNIVKYITELFSKENQENNSSYLVNEIKEGNNNNENEKVIGTPFFIVKNNEDGTDWLLAFGTYKLKTAKTKRELREYLVTDRYNIMCDMIIILVEMKENNTMKPTKIK